jgi:hypothetical protein
VQKTSLSFRGEVIGQRPMAENPESITLRPVVMDSGSVRRAGKEDDRENELKPFVAVQRVRLPPGKGAARQPEASLARVRQRHA